MFRTSEVNNLLYRMNSNYSLGRWRTSVPRLELMTSTCSKLSVNFQFSMEYFDAKPTFCHIKKAY